MSINKQEIEKIVCSKCGGVGQFQSKSAKGICVKCLGEGKLDWIENVVGKKLPKKIGVVNPGVYVEGGIMADVVQDEMSKNLCKMIDREILEGIKEELYEQKYIKERRKKKKVKV